MVSSQKTLKLRWRQTWHLAKLTTCYLDALQVHTSKMSLVYRQSILFFPTWTSCFFLWLHKAPYRQVLETHEHMPYTELGHWSVLSSLWSRNSSGSQYLILFLGEVGDRTWGSSACKADFLLLFYISFLGDAISMLGGMLQITFSS